MRVESESKTYDTEKVDEERLSTYLLKMSQVLEGHFKEKDTECKDDNR